MAIKTFNLPDPGEGLTEAEIVEWKVAVGDVVKVNDIVLEVETSKSLVELPIPWAGTVGAILVQVGDTVEVGAAIVSIDDGQGENSAPTPAIPGETAEPASGQEAILVGYGAKAGATARRARKGAPAARLNVPTETEQIAAAPPAPEPTVPAPREPVPTPTAAVAPGERPRAKPPVRRRHHA